MPRDMIENSAQAPSWSSHTHPESAEISINVPVLARTLTPTSRSSSVPWSPVGSPARKAVPHGRVSANRNRATRSRGRIRFPYERPEESWATTLTPRASAKPSIAIAPFAIEPAPPRTNPPSHFPSTSA